MVPSLLFTLEGLNFTFIDAIHRFLYDFLSNNLLSSESVLIHSVLFSTMAIISCFTLRQLPSMVSRRISLPSLSVNSAMIGIFLYCFIFAGTFAESTTISVWKIFYSIRSPKFSLTVPANMPCATGIYKKRPLFRR